MPTTFSCPYCDNPFHGQAAIAGGMVVCQACLQATRVPGPAAPPQPTGVTELGLALPNPAATQMSHAKPLGVLPGHPPQTPAMNAAPRPPQATKSNVPLVVLVPVVLLCSCVGFSVVAGGIWWAVRPAPTQGWAPGAVSKVPLAAAPRDMEWTAKPPVESTPAQKLAVQPSPGKNIDEQEKKPEPPGFKQGPEITDGKQIQEPSSPPTPKDDQPTPKDDPPTPSGIVLKRQSQLSDEDLRKQLLAVPEIGFNQVGAASLYANLRQQGNTPPNIGMTFFAQAVKGSGQQSPTSMPWQNGVDGQLGKENAERLQVLSTCLRDCLRASVPTGDIRPDVEKLQGLLTKEQPKGGVAKGGGFGGGFGGAPVVKSAEWKKPQALPTLTQMMQAENSPVRVLLVEMLGAIKGKEASTFLAYRAIFDLSPDVRAQAVQELAKRPSQEYQQALLYGLQYPWPAAADHAAEAIVALQLTGVLPELVSLLKQPDPTVPTKSEKGYVVRELVRVNHLCNCMLCHPPSFSKEDLVRGRVPSPSETPPPAYSGDQTGLFVRADLTYLRQDFSVVQPVPNAGKWPANQRYDYIVRVRPPTKSEMRIALQLEKDPAPSKSFPQREAVLAALRQVTKADAGETYDQWRAELPKLLKALRVDGETK